MRQSTVEANLAEPLPFGDAAFDTLIVSDVVEHILKPAWEGDGSRARAGGKILMNVPFYYRLSPA
ncbi:MAG: hypothetical protein ABI612_12305 [Betaproteobacteria bacterium]